MLNFPGGSMVKNLPANTGDTGSISELRRSPVEGNGNPLQYACLGNPMDRGAWQPTVHIVTKESDTSQRLKQQTKRLAQGVANKALPCQVGDGPFAGSLLLSGECPTAWEIPQSWAIQNVWSPRAQHDPKRKRTEVKQPIHWNPENAEGVHGSRFNQAASFSSPQTHFYYLTQESVWTEGEISRSVVQHGKCIILVQNCHSSRSSFDFQQMAFPACPRLLVEGVSRNLPHSPELYAVLDEQKGSPAEASVSRPPLSSHL